MRRRLSALGVSRCLCVLCFRCGLRPARERAAERRRRRSRQRHGRRVHRRGRRRHRVVVESGRHGRRRLFQRAHRSGQLPPAGLRADRGRRSAECAARQYAQFCRRISGPRPELLPPSHQQIQPGTSTGTAPGPTRGWSDGGPSALAGAEPVRRQRGAVTRIASGDRIDLQAGERGRRVAVSERGGELAGCRRRHRSSWRRSRLASTSGRWPCSAGRGLG